MSPRRLADLSTEKPTSDALEGEEDDMAYEQPDVTPKHELHQPSSWPPGTTDKIPFLDGLRGLAAICVVFQHTTFVADGFSVDLAAVDVFFVLSAFLLTLRFEQRAKELVSDRASIKRWLLAALDFFMRRLVRVYPLFVVVAIYLSLLPADEQKTFFLVSNPDDFSLIKVLTFDFDQRYFILWTLPLQFAYYLILPLFVIVTVKMGKWAPVLLTPLLAWCTYSGCTAFRSHHQRLGPHLATFVLGSITAFAYSRIHELMERKQINLQHTELLAVRSLEVASLVVFFSVLNSNALIYTWFMSNPIAQTPGAPYIAFNVVVVILCELLVPEGPVAAVLEWKLLRYAGKVSFSIYLLHAFVTRSAWPATQAPYNAFFAEWTLVFLVATVSYYVIEEPCQHLASHLGAKIKRRDEALIERERHLYGSLPIQSPSMKQSPPPPPTDVAMPPFS